MFMVKIRKLVPKFNLPAKATAITHLVQTKGWFWEARNRILAWYGLLMVAFIGLSVPIFSELVLHQIDRRVRADLVEELVENATQYTQQTDTIALGARLDRNFVRLWVRDTGMGIGEADQERIFERFARGTNSRRNSSGCGLGLFIVQAIAQAHGGKVELFSKLGFGSTFSLILPTEPITEKLAQR
jgi:signal transduction histidine kinase